MNKMRRFLLLTILSLVAPVLASQTVFADGFDKAAADPCANVTRPGFRVVDRTWAQLFKVEGGSVLPAVWPTTYPFLVATGSFTMRTTAQKSGTPAAGLVLTTPFTMDSGTHKFGWIGAQAVYLAGYRNPMSAEAMSVTISRCRADMRYNTSPFAEQQTECATVKEGARNGNLFYGVGATAKACQFPAGERLWITIHFAGTSTDPKHNTCAPRNPSEGKYCDSNVQAH